MCGLLDFSLLNISVSKLLERVRCQHDKQIQSYLY